MRFGILPRRIDDSNRTRYRELALHLLDASLHIAPIGRVGREPQIGPIEVQSLIPVARQPMCLGEIEQQLGCRRDLVSLVEFVDGAIEFTAIVVRERSAIVLAGGLMGIGGRDQNQSDQGPSPHRVRLANGSST